MITGQALKNTLWTAADLFSYPMLMIAVTPFFIKELGAEEYGLWMLINVVVQVMNVLNFGVGDSTIKEVSSYDARDAKQLMQGSFSRNLSLSVLLMFGSVGLGMICAMAINHWNWFHIPEIRKEKAIAALVLFSWSAGLKFIEQVFISVFKGLQRFDIASRLTMSSRLSAIIGAFVAVYMGYGILEIVEVALCCNIVNLSVQGFMLYRFVGIKTFLPRFQSLYTLALFKTNGWYWLQSVIALLGFLSDRLLIGYLGDLKTVGYYSIAALIGSQIHNILLAFGGFIFPKVSAYNASNKSTEHIYYISRLLIAGLGWTVVIVLLLFGDTVFKLWLGETTYLEAGPYIKLYLSFISIILLIIVPFHFINGSERVSTNSLFELVLRGSHLIAMYLGFVFGGVQGLVWGLIITTALNIPFQYYIFHKLIIGFSDIKQAFAPILPALAIVFIGQAPTLAFRLLGLIIFVLLLWIIYYKKANMNNFIKTK